ncbi:glycosyltransferase family 2 protein [Aquisalimonas asiatica]|uniref:Glycosyl transferase family 2 n=1 Tax=Aquisalimonas asiatica TaxID=406100 RepID=A0A1H8U437_9GAMM|nr:glycosyltransferase [Aquisalimonas asiatica]SEO97931.1 Glycosyl transferase family 2 [Aquisalimonas asiatica]
MRVSVVIPVFNGMPHIPEAIDSVLRQRHDDLEVLVIDDGSNDGTRKAVSAYGAPVVLLSTDAPRSGPAAARNVGLRAATGDLIAFLDADDVWLGNKLAEQVAYMSGHPEVGLVSTNSRYWRPRPDGTYPSPDEAAAWADASAVSGDGGLSGWLYYEILLKPSTVWTSTVLMHRWLLDKVGLFNESLRLGQDYDYWLRASRHTPIHRLPGCHALYRQHEDNSTGRPRPVNFELQIFDSAMRRWGRLGPDGRSVPRNAVRERYHRLNFRMGYHHYWRGDPGVAMRSFAAALRWRPHAPKTWAYLMASSAKRIKRGGASAGLETRAE